MTERRCNCCGQEYVMTALVLMIVKKFKKPIKVADIKMLVRGRIDDAKPKEVYNAVASLTRHKRIKKLGYGSYVAHGIRQLRRTRNKSIKAEAIWPGITALAKRGSLLVPTQISWRRANRLVVARMATIYPFHERWLGRVDVTERGRAAAHGQDESAVSVADPELDQGGADV